ncbi:cytochrome c [Glaciecola sp. SC05]|uniref:c-type cytochrome n=1 Tax=Glaciecola sp. SC05 TaxID=1987355 RepID=UPI0035285ADF
MNSHRKALCANGSLLKSSLASLVVIVSIALSGCGQPAALGDPALGQDKSTMCAQCHGKNGISIVPIYPNLAGQKEQYLVLSIKAYRSGERVNMAMTPHARKLSDEDIADLAAYYASMDPAGGGILQN